jgi:hypothetical protein
MSVLVRILHVIPAKAGIHSSARAGLAMDSRFRGNDGNQLAWRAFR